MRLSSREKETIISFNEAEDVAHVYICSRAWMSRLQDLGLEPTRVHSDNGHVYAREYELPKAWLRKPTKPRRLSPKERERLKAHMRRVREASGGR